MRTIGRPGKKNICTLSSHRATRELYAKVPSPRAPVGALCASHRAQTGALCEGSSMRLYNASSWQHEFFTTDVNRQYELNSIGRILPGKCAHV